MTIYGINLTPYRSTKSIPQPDFSGYMPASQVKSHHRSRGLWTCLLWLAWLWPGVHVGYGQQHVHSDGEAELSHSQMAKSASNDELSDKLFEAKKNAPVYTCPMHPQIKQPAPGRCPICGMELVLVESQPSTSTNTDEIEISLASRRLAGIETTMVETKHLNRQVKAIGNIHFDESRLATITAYVAGRIEKLYADYTGIAVNKGDHLAVVYSPALYSAQVEFLQARRTLNKLSANAPGPLLGTQQQLAFNAKTKLTELGMSKTQIDQLIRSGKAESRLEIFAPMGGTVIEKPASQGQYLKEGQTIFKIADLSTVWLMINVFSEDASNIHYGQQVEAVVRALPDRVFKGRVAFVSPVVNPLTRTVEIRVEVPNPNGELRPGDYAEAEISVPVSIHSGSNKVFDKSLAGKFLGPMHPQIVRDKPGQCPICGMDLVEAEKFGFAKEADEQELLLGVPRNAVLRIGRTSVVFVEESTGKFLLRSVKTGPSVGAEIVIVEGLEEYETIATDGVFLLDSQMQLSGKTSLIDVSTIPTSRQK